MIATQTIRLTAEDHAEIRANELLLSVRRDRAVWFGNGAVSRFQPYKSCSAARYCVCGDVRTNQPCGRSQLVGDGVNPNARRGSLLIMWHERDKSVDISTELPVDADEETRKTWLKKTAKVDWTEGASWAARLQYLNGISVAPRMNVNVSCRIPGCTTVSNVIATADAVAPDTKYLCASDKHSKTEIFAAVGKDPSNVDLKKMLASVKCDKTCQGHSLNTHRAMVKSRFAKGSEPNIVRKELQEPDYIRCSADRYEPPSHRFHDAAIYQIFDAPEHTDWYSTELPFSEGEYPDASRDELHSFIFNGKRCPIHRPVFQPGDGNPYKALAPSEHVHATKHGNDVRQFNVSGGLDTGNSGVDPKDRSYFVGFYKNGNLKRLENNTFYKNYFSYAEVPSRALQLYWEHRLKDALGDSYYWFELRPDANSDEKHFKWQPPKKRSGPRSKTNWTIKEWEPFHRAGEGSLPDDEDFCEAGILPYLIESDWPQTRWEGAPPSYSIQYNGLKKIFLERLTAGDYGVFKNEARDIYRRLNLGTGHPESSPLEIQMLFNQEGRCDARIREIILENRVGAEAASEIGMKDKTMSKRVRTTKTQIAEKSNAEYQAYAEKMFAKISPKKMKSLDAKGGFIVFKWQPGGAKHLPIKVVRVIEYDPLLNKIAVFDRPGTWTDFRKDTASRLCAQAWRKDRDRVLQSLRKRYRGAPEFELLEIAEIRADRAWRHCLVFYLGDHKQFADFWASATRSEFIASWFRPDIDKYKSFSGNEDDLNEVLGLAAD